ncbi:small ubiquitin-related modifier 1-like isoform X2 [Syzygium oleosum]|uniref:small ubiquitin-related modifier 1-like isoform X2 n=1 Tax=Syzygium oleosum TaxID=219896 RepID=UPI0011D1FD93|nr:small ubiquitin-related modifier 1-like isoform X2 [Syzygium oleosum]
MPASSNNNEAEKINVVVRGQDNRILYFKINGTVRLSKMFAIYCEMRQLEVQTVQFLYEGNRITGNQTPQGLGLEDGAEICAFVHQSGGGRQQRGRCTSC